MEELSIKEKAKRYNEALEIAKKNYVTAQNLCKGSQIGGECFKNTLEKIFPELKESEDEKIKKAIIKSLPKRGYLPQTSITVKNAIAWLEKQGKQKTIWHNEDEEPQRGRLILLIMQSGTAIVAKINEKYHTVKVSCLDELNRKAVLYDAFLDKTCEWMREEFYTSKDRDGHNILISASWDNVEELIKDLKKQTEE